MRRLRALVYRLGYRPKPPSILYSPSLSLSYSMRGADLEAAMAAGVASAERVLAANPELRRTLDWEHDA